MRRYPSPASLHIGKPERSLWLAYSKISTPLLLPISGSHKDHCGWTMRRYPSPASLYIGKPERSLWLAYAKISISLLLSISGSPKDPCGCLCEDTHAPAYLYREAIKILVAGLCEDTHPLLLSISGSPKDPCGWPMRRYPSPSLYRFLVAGLFGDHPPASPHIGKP